MNNCDDSLFIGNVAIYSDDDTILINDQVNSTE